MVLAFKHEQFPIQDALGPTTDNQTVPFDRSVKRDHDGTARADVAISGFKLDQVDNAHLQSIDVIQLQVGNVSVTNNLVSFKITSDYTGKTKARYTGHVAVLVIADIEDPPT